MFSLTIDELLIKRAELRTFASQKADFVEETLKSKKLDTEKLESYLVEFLSALEELDKVDNIILDKMRQQNYKPDEIQQMVKSIDVYLDRFRDLKNLLLKKQGELRCSFSKKADLLEKILKNEQISVEELKSCLEEFLSAYNELAEMDRIMLNYLLGMNSQPAEIQQMLFSIHVCRDRCIDLTAKTQEFLLFMLKNKRITVKELKSYLEEFLSAYKELAEMDRTILNYLLGMNSQPAEIQQMLFSIHVYRDRCIDLTAKTQEFLEKLKIKDRVKDVLEILAKAGLMTGAVLGGAALAVPALGFGSGGIAAGSLAAMYQSSFLGGTIASGSLFATLQSIGAAGLAASTNFAVVAGSTMAATLHKIFKKN